jgi:hypothetical protein
MWELGAGFSLHVDVAIARDKKGCDVTMGIMGGGDVWSGGFVLMHFPDGIKQWTETSSSYPIQYTKAYVNQSVTIPGGITVTETGTYTITIRRGDGG